jgi:hypothetical protein
VEPHSDQPHTFYKPWPGVTVAYWRDRGDAPSAVDRHNGLADLIHAAMIAGAVYVYAGVTSDDDANTIGWSVKALSGHLKPHGWMSIPKAISIEALCKAAGRAVKLRA